MQTYKTVDEYLENFSGDPRRALETIRNNIQRAFPAAEETISYGIPTYKIGKKRVHFGGYETHIGLYPGAGVIEQLENDLKNYETSKGTIRFTFDKNIPYELIERIVATCLN